ncbi:hypothetical protein HU200_063525 [Digitaria exilis]|uniref:Anthocyanidin reductase n=1 Tax=Digitaria exilis TaxID=1010633 RepID=A0A835A5R8_9POAL|nr:hypothetical protein HU200_063525 [Digitaria exilis]
MYVDDTKKNSHFKDLQALGPLTVLRADLEVQGSFDDAVAGCDYAFLVAAPVNLTPSENPEVRCRAWTSITRNSYNVSLKLPPRQVAMHSSTERCSRLLPAVLPDVRHAERPDRAVRARDSERDEVVRASRDGEARGLDLGGILGLHQAAGGRRPLAGRGVLVRPRGYVVSKVLSEKEALRFAAEHSMSLAIACPVLTVGSSPVPEVYTSVPASLSMLSGETTTTIDDDAEKLNSRPEFSRCCRCNLINRSGDEVALGMLKGIEKSFGGVPMVALDDLCRAEVFLAETDAASRRYICSSLDTTVVEMARFLADKYPQYSNNVNTASEHSGEVLEKPRVRLSSAKLVKEGFEFRYSTLDEIYQDVVEYGKAVGILPY